MFLDLVLSTCNILYADHSKDNKKVVEEKSQEENKDKKKDLKFKVSGFIQPSFIGRTQEKDAKRQADFQIAIAKVLIEGILSNPNGLDVIAAIRLSPQLNEMTADRLYALIKHADYGELMLGNNKDDKLVKNAIGLVGPGFQWFGALDANYDNIDGTFTGIDAYGFAGTATKAFYVTPKILDLIQFGISYTPSTAHVGSLKILRYDTDNKDAKAKPPYGWTSKKPIGYDSISISARIEKECTPDMSVGVSGFYLRDQAYIDYKELEILTDGILVALPGKKIQVNNANSFGVGALIKFYQISLGIDYINNGKTHLPKDNNLYNKGLYEYENGYKGNAGQSILAVLQYRITENLTSAFGYQWTERKLNKDAVTRKTFTVALWYKIMDGFEIYSEFDRILSKQSGSKENAKEDNGWFATIGVKVSF